MVLKALSIVAAFQGVPIQATNTISAFSGTTERVCIFDEEIKAEVHYLITECVGIDKLPLEGEIPGEECYITLDFNRRCENSDIPMD